MGNLEGRELGWDDTIEKDSDFTLLPDGDYDFIVESFERGRHAGSEKLPPCNKAIVKIRIDAPEGATIISHQLFLHTVTEGMLSAFFASIGQKKKGEKATMNWSLVPTSTGRAKIGSHTNPNDPDKKYNEIKKFYPKEEKQYTEGDF